MPSLELDSRDPEAAVPKQFGLSSGAVRNAIAAQVMPDGLRSLGPQMASGARDPKVSASPFAEPKHKLGDIDQYQPGVGRVWHSDNCYTTLGDITRTHGLESVGGNPESPILGAATAKCALFKAGKKPRGDLFEGVKKRTAEE